MIEWEVDPGGGSEWMEAKFLVCLVVAKFFPETSTFFYHASLHFVKQ
jgi:hypothetical protein